MTVLAAFLSLVLAFAGTALSARMLIPKFREKGLSRTSMTERDGAFIPGETAAGMGVIPLTMGLAAGILTGGIAAIFTGGDFITVTAFRIFGGLVFVLLTALAGGLDDWRSLRGRETVHPIVNAALYAVIARFYTALLSAGGDRSDILILPFFGQGDIGVFYDVFCMVLVLAAVFCGSAQSEACDISSASAMFTGLSLTAAGGILGSTPAAVLGASLAGSALASLIWSFPPAKLLCGKGGGAVFGAAAAAAAMGCGIPALLIPAALPLVCEGIFFLAKPVFFACTGRQINAGSFAGWLCGKGLSYRSVSLIMAGISLAGLVLTLAAAFCV